MPLCFSFGEFDGKYKVAENLDRSYGDGSDKMFQWAEVCSDDDLPLNYWQKDSTSDQANIHGMLHVGGESGSQFATGYDLDQQLRNFGIEDTNGNECTSRTQRHVATSAACRRGKKVSPITDFRAICRAATFDAKLVENGNIDEEHQDLQLCDVETFDSVMTSFQHGLCFASSSPGKGQTARSTARAGSQCGWSPLRGMRLATRRGRENILGIP